MLESRNYNKEDCVIFRATKEQFGGLSNMAHGYPIWWSIIYVKSSEALYQALRYPDNIDIQKKILVQASPMAAKMISKKFYKQTRADWDTVKFKIMKLCLELKLINNWLTFYDLLKSTGNKDIVENSHSKKVWGAIDKGDYYEGENALGRLLMGLRQEYVFSEPPKNILIPKIDKISIMGITVDEIDYKVPMQVALELF